MMKAPRRQFLFDAGKTLGGLALIQAVPGWAFATRNPAADLVHRSSYGMGTSIRLSLLKDEFSNDAVNDAFRRLQDVDGLLTVHHASSALMRVNGGERVSGREISDVARAAQHFGDVSEGAMDVTVLPAMRRLGFVPGASTEGLIDYRQLRVDGTTVSMGLSGVGADFGGIAKGYGVDRAIEAAHNAGATAALIDAGGDLYALGRPDADRPWKIGIRHPAKEQDLVATLEVENEAVATSGIYLQKRTVTGKEVSHIVDPVSGYSVNHVVSATIVARDTMTADALATAVSVASRSQGQALVDSQAGVEGFLIYSDGTSFTSKGLKNRLQLL
jgi:thiamine biosynthesis lipoprotein